MKQNILETLVGFIVIIIALLFFTYAYNANNTTDNADGYLLTGRFQNAEGIVEGSDVMLAGIKVGFVESLTLDKENFAAVLNLRINKDLHLPKDTEAAVTSTGFLGGKFIGITPGSEEENLVENGQIKYTRSTINLESLIGKFMYSLGK